MFVYKKKFSEIFIWNYDKFTIYQNYKIITYKRFKEERKYTIYLAREINERDMNHVEDLDPQEIGKSGILNVKTAVDELKRRNITRLEILPTGKY